MLRLKFLCSTQLSLKLQLLIKNKKLINKDLSFKLSLVVFIMLINVKMPRTVGIFTFIMAPAMTMAGALSVTPVRTLNMYVRLSQQRPLAKSNLFDQNFMNLVTLFSTIMSS